MRTIRRFVRRLLAKLVKEAVRDELNARRDDGVARLDKASREVASLVSQLSQSGAVAHADAPGLPSPAAGAHHGDLASSLKDLAGELRDTALLLTKDRDNPGRQLRRQQVFFEALRVFQASPPQTTANGMPSESRSKQLRRLVHEAAGIKTPNPNPSLEDGMVEFEFLQTHYALLRPAFQHLAGKRVLYAGQAYYNAWYLSRQLRTRGWKADLLNWDTNPGSQIHYHGEDFRFASSEPSELALNLEFYLEAVYSYDIFHFSNAHCICFGFLLQDACERQFGKYSEIRLLKDLGKYVVYTNNGCLDGVSQTSFSQWGAEPVCNICRWRNEPSVCSDERNLEWGAFRNSVADYQCLSGGNRADYNVDPRVHEVPEFYCLDPEIWRPDLVVPMRHRLPPAAKGTIRLYHGIGQRAERTLEGGVNIKSSHVYMPLVVKLTEEGIPVELVEPIGMPNFDVRFMQVQSDIFLDMLTYGWFGATAREAMMLGKPVICYLRPEWLQSASEEVPEYVAELPIVSATPETVEAVLRDLIANPAKRREIGARSRAFAVKWHSAEAGARRLDEIYSGLLRGDPLLRPAPPKE